MSAKKWFVLEQTIEGPLSIEDLEFLLTQKPHLQIWGKGMTEWLPLDKWRQFVETQADYKAQLREESSALGLSWKIRVEGQEKDPMTFHQMINELRKKTDYSVIDLWNSKNGTWREVYAYNAVVEELGITRRSHPRVPIVGSVTCETQQGVVKIPLVTISEGGAGLSEVRHLQIGEKFKISISSPNLFVTVNASCEVVYVGPDGYTGLKFLSITVEAKSAIIEYVNKFENI